MFRAVIRRIVLAAVGLIGTSAVLAGCTLSPTSSPTTKRPQAAATTAASPGAAYRVGHLDYDLGDRAFTKPWFYGFGADGFPDPSTRAPMELAATVSYPIDSTPRKHPLVEISHGLWYSCADRSVDAAVTRAYAELAKLPQGTPKNGMKPAPDPRAARWQAILDRDVPKLNGWPCKKGIPTLPSYRGYDYLAQQLASHGIIVVSIGQNGSNNGDQNTADRARAATANRHLAMWSQLARTGGGPLAGHLLDSRTHRPADVDFQGRVDLSHVGLVGHSRGGRGVMWQAADPHREDLPKGVSVRAVVALAAATMVNIPAGDPRQQQYLPTRTPVLSWVGTCDGAIPDADDWISRLRTGPHGALAQLTVTGANHNFLNTQWSPASGQVQGSDDATHPSEGSSFCKQDRQHAVGTGSAVRQLTEAQERAVVTTYVARFLEQQLQGGTAFDRLSAASAPNGVRVRLDRSAPSKG